MALTKAQTSKISNNKESILLEWTPKSKTVFKVLPGNREINNNHVTKLRKIIKEYGMLSTPLMVATKRYNGKGDNKLHLYILDGQHRIEACLKDSVSFNYRVIRLEDIATIVDLMAKLNNSDKSWTIDNFINSYCLVPDLSNDYNLLRQFTIKNNDYSTTLCANLLHFGNLTHRQSDMVKKGKFQYTYENKAKEALALFDMVSLNVTNAVDQKIKRALRSMAFRSSLLEFVKEHKAQLDVAKFIQQFTKEVIALEDIPSTAGEWSYFMNAYMKRNSNKITIDMTEVKQTIFA